MDYIDVTIGDSGRDAGKTFRITEMPAEKGEFWAFRLIGVLLDADKDGELTGLAKIASGNMETVAAAGMSLVLKIMLKSDPEKLKPLMDEMKSCWSFKADSDGKDFVRKLEKDDIKEISTFVYLRAKTLEFHLSFFMESIQGLMG